MGYTGALSEYPVDCQLEDLSAIKIECPNESTFGMS